MSASKSPLTIRHVEQILTQVWADVLVRDVTNEDEFFRIGGNSLHAIRITQRLSSIIGFEIPVTLIIGAAKPTPRSIAEEIIDGRWNFSDSLRTLQRSRSGAPPLALVHAVSGTTNRYQPLIYQLKVDRKIIGISSHGLDPNNHPDSSVEAMARRYCLLLRQSEKLLPILVGYSMGGVIAFEMARQSDGEGDPFPDLILLDPPSISMSHTTEKDNSDTRDGYWTAYLARKLLNLHETPPELIGLSRNEALTWILQSCQRAGIISQSYGITRLRRMLDLHEVNAKALRNYTPTGVARRALLITSSSSDQRLRERTWNRHIRSLEPFRVDCSHAGILQLPKVDQVASILRARINQAAKSRCDPPFSRP